MGIGIIGLGRLGAPLVQGLARAGVAEVYAFSRTRDKAEQVVGGSPGVTLVDSAAEVLQRCDPVFVWMAPPQVEQVLENASEALGEANPILVTCSPGQRMERFSTRWVDTLPNVNSATGSGGTLVTWGPGLSEDDRESVREPLRAVGAVYEVEPGDLDAFCALTSNGPALYARMMQIWADAVADRHGLDTELCRAMVRQTMQGTLALQDGEGIGADEVVYRVAHPGGSTEKALAVLEPSFSAMAAQMLQAMGKW